MPDEAHQECPYQKLFDLALDMLCIAGTDGYFREVNPSFARVLGFTAEELLSKPFIEFVHTDDVQSTLDQLDKLNMGGSAHNFENRYRRADGEYRTLSWTAYVEDGNDQIYAVARDVTAERHTQNNLMQIQKALNDKTIVAITDRNGAITEVNDKFCEISGYSREELIGQNHRIINSGKHTEKFFAHLWETISSGKSWSGMIENKNKNGDHYFVQSIITPLFDPQGEISNYLAVRFDTTKHIRIRNQLHKTLSILNETGAIARVGGWELDVATGELTWTDETFKILEVEKRDDQKPVLPEGLELFVDEHKPIIGNAVYRAIEFGEPYSLELKARTAKGNVLWVYTNGKANYENGKVVTLSGTIQDINDKKLSEEKYELEHMKALQASKLASLGEMSAGIAHEINNPLTIISGAIELLPKYINKPENFEKKLSAIKKSCNRIARIVRSLKKFSRTSEESTKEPCSVKDIVHEAMILTNIKSQRFSIPVESSLNTSALILCDEVEIEQVVVNLINNAIDAAKEAPEKWVSVALEDEGDSVILKVIDSGPGITPEIEQKLFNPFFTTKRIGDGNGLGLSISKGILDEHEATIVVDRTMKNTCFTVRFPAYKGESNDA